MLASLPIRWLSHPSALADAEYKPRQLALLRQSGLVTPPTLVTNDPAAVRAFAAAHDDLAVKPLAEPIVWEGGGESVVFTRRAMAKDLDTLAGVETTAHLFQAFQEKRCECRVTAVGVDRLFTVAIHAGSSKSYVDWRSDYASLRYEVIETPEHIRAGIARYLRDRILATCAITGIPREWIRQLADGGRIVAPLDAGTAGPLLVLDKTAPDEVTGRIDSYPAWFMPLREHPDNPLAPGQSTGFTATGMAHYGTTATDPASLLTDDPDLALFLWLHLPGLRVAGGPPSGSVVAHTADALAEAQLVPGEDGTWQVAQRGPHRLWDTIEHAITAFETLGRPHRSRFGVTALDDPHRQYVWLDEPNGAHSFPLPGGSK